MKMIKCKNNILSLDEKTGSIISWILNNQELIQTLGVNPNKFGFTLFPFVGKNKYKFLTTPNNEKIKTKMIHLEENKKIKVIDYAHNRVSFEIDYKLIDESTPLVLKICYQIYQSKLKVNLKVINKGEEKLWYQIGHQVAFKLWGDFKSHNWEDFGDETFILNDQGLVMKKKKEIDNLFWKNFITRNVLLWKGDTLKINNQNLSINLNNKNLSFISIQKNQKDEFFILQSLSHLPGKINDDNKIDSSQNFEIDASQVHNFEISYCIN